MLNPEQVVRNMQIADAVYPGIPPLSTGSRKFSAETTVYTREKGDDLVSRLLNFATTDKDCCYHEGLGNHQLAGGRKVKITITTEDVDDNP